MLKIGDKVTISLSERSLSNAKDDLLVCVEQGYIDGRHFGVLWDAYGNTASVWTIDEVDNDKALYGLTIDGYEACLRVDAVEVVPLPEIGHGRPDAN